MVILKVTENIGGSSILDIYILHAVIVTLDSYTVFFYLDRSFRVKIRPPAGIT